MEDGCTLFDATFEPALIYTLVSKNRSAIMRADVVKAILDAQGLPTDAPFIRPCRGSPSGELFEVWWR